MRRHWLALIALVAACGESPVDPPPTPQCEPGSMTISVPTATSEVVASTATHEDIRLTCFLNATPGPVEYRYRVAVLQGDSAVDDVPWTEWMAGDMPIIRVVRHAQFDKALVWDVRSDLAVSTSLRIVAHYTSTPNEIMLR